MFEKRASQIRRQSKEAMLNGIDIHESFMMKPTWLCSFSLFFLPKAKMLCTVQTQTKQNNKSSYHVLILPPPLLHLCCYSGELVLDH